MLHYQFDLGFSICCTVRNMYLTSAIPMRARMVTSNHGNSSGSAALHEMGISSVSAETAARHKAKSHLAPYISASLY